MSSQWKILCFYNSTGAAYRLSLLHDASTLCPTSFPTLHPLCPLFARVMQFYSSNIVYYRDYWLKLQGPSTHIESHSPSHSASPHSVRSSAYSRVCQLRGQFALCLYWGNFLESRFYMTCAFMVCQEKWDGAGWSSDVECAYGWMSLAERHPGTYVSVCQCYDAQWKLPVKVGVRCILVK